MCGAVCKSGICKTSTCPGCREVLSPSSSITVPVTIRGKEMAVSFCICTTGRLFAIWALSCGWHIPPKPKPSDRKRSSMVNKVRSHLHKTPTSLGTQPPSLPNHPNNPPLSGTVPSKGVGYGSALDHFVDADSALYGSFSYFGYLTPKEVIRPKHSGPEDDPIQVSIALVLLIK